MTTMTYKELDAQIAAAVKRGRSPIYASEVSQEASRIAQATGRETNRVIDGRLQALRKAGVIEFVSSTNERGWRVVETP